MVLLEIFKTI